MGAQTMLIVIGPEIGRLFVDIASSLCGILGVEIRKKGIIDPIEGPSHGTVGARIDSSGPEPEATFLSATCKTDVWHFCSYPHERLGVSRSWLWKKFKRPRRCPSRSGRVQVLGADGKTADAYFLFQGSATSADTRHYK